MTQAVNSSGIWKNMVRKLEAPLQSPRRRGRFKPMPLDPVIIEEESDLLSPRSLVGGATGDVPAAENSADGAQSGATPGDQFAASRYQVTSV